MVSAPAKEKGNAYSATVEIPSGTSVLKGDLVVPEDAHGLVIFVHGSGSSRHSPRNQYVARIFNQYHLGTLLTDLLTEEEERIDQQTRHLRFDIPLLADRLENIGAWVHENPDTHHLPTGYFGASTGAAAALIEAARHTKTTKAVVSRGGRPDLAMEMLPQVRVPVLLIVGGNDPEVLKLNRQALEKLNSQSSLHIVPHATHLFEEPGALDEAAYHAALWFVRHMEAI